MQRCAFVWDVGGGMRSRRQNEKGGKKKEAAENWSGAKRCSFAAILKGRASSKILIFILQV